MQELLKLNFSAIVLTTPAFPILLYASYQSVNLNIAALSWVNKILQNKKQGIRINLENYARLLNLMIHFELDNIVVLRYAINSTRRFLKKQDGLNPFSDNLLKFFSKLTKSRTKNYKALFQQAQQALFESKPPLVNAEIQDYLDIKTWIDLNLEKL